MPADSCPGIGPPRVEPVLNRFSQRLPGSIVRCGPLASAQPTTTRVVELVMAGWTYEAIAREVGYRSKGSVSKAFWRAVTAHEEVHVRTG